MSTDDGQLARHGELEPALSGAEPSGGHGGPGSRSFLFLTCASAAQCNPHPPLPDHRPGEESWGRPRPGRGWGCLNRQRRDSTPTRGEGMAHGLAVPRWNAGASVEQAWLHTRIRMNSAWWTDRPSVSRPSCPSCSIDADDWRPRLSPEPPVLRCLPLLPGRASKHIALCFPVRGTASAYGTATGGRYLSDATVPNPSLFPDPLTRPPDCRRQAPPIPVGQSAEWSCSVHSGHRVLKLSSGRPRPPSILDGRSAYRYAS